jgi:hypothetical protein
MPLRRADAAETIEYVRANGCPTEYLSESDDDESGGDEGDGDDGFTGCLT